MIREVKVEALDGVVEVVLFDPELDKSVGKMSLDWVPDANRVLVAAEAQPFDDPAELTVEVTTERVARLIVNGRTGLDTTARSTLYKLRSLATLGEPELRLMSPLAWKPDEFLVLSVRYLNVGGNGLLASVVAHGSDIDVLVDELFEKVTTLDEPLYLVSDKPGQRRAFLWDEGLGGFVRVDEKTAVS